MIFFVALACGGGPPRGSCDPAVDEARVAGARPFLVVHATACRQAVVPARRRPRPCSSFVDGRTARGRHARDAALTRPPVPFPFPFPPCAVRGRGGADGGGRRKRRRRRVRGPRATLDEARRRATAVSSGGPTRSSRGLPVRVAGAAHPSVLRPRPHPLSVHSHPPRTPSFSELIERRRRATRSRRARRG